MFLCCKTSIDPGDKSNINRQNIRHSEKTIAEFINIFCILFGKKMEFDTILLKYFTVLDLILVTV